MILHRFWAAWVLALVLWMPSIGSAGPLFTFAVWLDGAPTAGPPNGVPNAIPSALDDAFGTGSATLVSTADLEKAGFLNAFDAVVISRFGSDTGKPLSSTAVANIQSYVGKDTDPKQGGVAVFTNDAADSLFLPPGTPRSDPYDPNLNQLFINSAGLAAATHHGYIGELNGAVMAMSSNDAQGFPAIGLLPGVASNVEFFSNDPNLRFIYGVGPIGEGHPIDAGIDFPFATQETSLFLTFITDFKNGNIVDWYENDIPRLFHSPAVVANEAAIGGIIPPPPSIPAPPTLVLLGLGLMGLAAWKRGRRNRSSDD